MSLDLLAASVDFVRFARPSVAYCRRLGLDWPTTEASCGGVYMAPITPDRRWFDFNPEGVEAAVIEARAADAETVTDLVAWLTDEPSRWWTAIGAAVALGEAAAVNPASYFGDTPLRLHRTPEAWLRAGCGGACILDPTRGARWLLDVPTSTIAAEDDAHAAEIERARQTLVQRQRLVVPVRAAA